MTTLLPWRVGTSVFENSLPKYGIGARLQQRRRVTVLLWATFCLGLFAQALAPGLKVRNNAFVIPSSLVSNGKEIRPTEIVARERQMQWLSVILTVGGALGLAFRYRRTLVRPRTTKRKKR